MFKRDMEMYISHISVNSYQLFCGILEHLRYYELISFLILVESL